MSEELIRERQRLVQYDEQAVVKGRLVLMRVFASFAKIFFRLLIESLLAAERTEVVGLSLVFGLASGSRRVNIHVADGVMYGSCHLLSPFV